MERIQINLSEAKTELLDAQDWLFHVRKGGFPEWFYPAAVRRRHAAADRVWDLQCMIGGFFDYHASGRTKAGNCIC
jgi:hypothetical protein